MRFLHIGDLHIGKKVNECSMLEDQAYILYEILQIIEEHHVEGVLIAGDVYDKAIPSIEAIQLLDDFLTKLAKAQIPVYMISGNHDSSQRLAFGSYLMKEEGVYISPVYDGSIKQVRTQDEYGDIIITLLPFLKPAMVRPYFPDSEINTYQEALLLVMNSIALDKNKRNILVAHQFVMGGERCESEDLNIGGLDQIDARLFHDFDYVALGHLHNPQKIERETIRYSGSPLKYSFSEAKHPKSAVLIDLYEKGRLQVQCIPLHPKHELREIKGSYMELTAKAFYENSATDDYLHITLTDEEEIVDAIGKLRSIYPNIMRLDYDNTRSRFYQEVHMTEETIHKTPLMLIQELYQLQNNQAMDEQQSAYCEALIESIWGGEEK